MAGRAGLRGRLRPDPEKLRTAGVGAASLAGLIVLWWLTAAFLLKGHGIPTPLAVVREFHDQGFGYYERIFAITLHEAAIGYLWGVGIALALATVVLLVPWLEPVIMQFSVITYCVPIVVLAPILIICHEIPTVGGISQTAVDLAALLVVFTTVVGAVVGFQSADRTSLDVVRVYGGGSVQQFFRVRVVSALPAIFSTLQLAAPTAYLGALLGEWFDRHLEVGVGPSLYLAQNNRETALAWTLGLSCALVSGLAYVLIGLIGRTVTPWAKGQP
ncbi:ABC transporter permease [Nocardioides cavernaquae]|uniref:ABC transporter permease subunit n=1 Tax=Nocardioides cavernaquae TaxID=2321396 RepID=A0A3A5H7E7_9ACTN|nr:ABC transporter permease subunit [Nocardioides cavernaquae]RJS46576.1 ABC transporter permease subunit [Nocardioides cavernaquae]